MVSLNSAPFAPAVVAVDWKNFEKLHEIFNAIQVLVKSSSIFQHFDWYNSHSQGQDVEWKIYITVYVT